MRTMKAKIPKALREQVWLARVGAKFSTLCPTSWCRNKISVFDFQVGHDVPESKGGATTIDNLLPLCSRCNASMSNVYTFKEWTKRYSSKSWFCWKPRVTPS